MPESFADLAWYLFNGAFFLLIAWAKYDLGEIKKDMRETRKLADANTLEIAKHQAMCAEKHRALEKAIEYCTPRRDNHGN